MAKRLRIVFLAGITALTLAACGGEDTGVSDVSIGQASGKPDASPPAASPPATPSTSTNTAPTISGTAATQVLAGQAYRFRPSAADPEGSTLSFSISSKPAWATFNVATGELAGTPTVAQVGSYKNIVISVHDGAASASLQAFGIDVTQPAPVTGSAVLTWLPPIENSDGTPLTTLTGYRIFYGTDPNALKLVTEIANQGITSYVFENLAQGTHYFAIKSYSKVANSTSVVESALSPVVSKTI